MLEIKDSDKRATVYLYGTIGPDLWDEEAGNNARDFAEKLDGLGGKPVDIRIDSSGGDVYEGFAIASAIQRYTGETTAYIDGLAASAASYIAIMADRVVMNDFAQFMIHDAWTTLSGNANDLLLAAERLDAVDSTIGGLIAKRTGREVADVRRAMDAETWFGAADAVEYGLCDEVVETGQRIAARLDPELAARYRNVPQCLLGESHAGGNLREAFVLGNKVYFKED